MRELSHQVMSALGRSDDFAHGGSPSSSAAGVLPRYFLLMTSLSFLSRVRFLGAMLLSLCPVFHGSAAQDFLGRWALTLPDGRAGWLEVKAGEGNWFDGSLLWGGGSVLPVASMTIFEDVLTVTRLRDIPRLDADGKVVRRHQLTDVITGRVDGDVLRLVITAPRADGSGPDRSGFTGQRIPALPPRPDLSRVTFGSPIQLFNGRDLSGWSLLEPQATNGWEVDAGVLVNRPVQVEGQPRKRYGNLRTEREFEDFELQLEVNVPAGSNSGVYLRGIYEVQVQDTHGRAPNSHHMGAIYSRITPSTAAEKPAGEWQTLRMILVDRHVTVELNGTTIIDNQPLEGCTGGALWSDESRPGPIYLQGDHGPIQYRHLMLRPVVR
jgi:hypothetical protein